MLSALSCNCVRPNGVFTELAVILRALSCNCVRPNGVFTELDLILRAFELQLCVAPFTELAEPPDKP
jgi:hypothetical protein